MNSFLLFFLASFSLSLAMNCDSPFQSSKSFPQGPVNLQASIALGSGWSGCSNLQAQKETCCSESVLKESGKVADEIVNNFNIENAAHDQQLLDSYNNLTYTYSLYVNVTEKYKDIYSELVERKTAISMSKGVVDPLSKWIKAFEEQKAKLSNLVASYKIQLSAYQLGRQMCQDTLIDATTKIRCLGCQVNLTDFYDSSSKSLLFDQSLCKAITSSCYPLIRLQEFSTKHGNSTEFYGKLNTTLPIATGVMQALDKLKGEVGKYFDELEKAPHDNTLLMKYLGIAAQFPALNKEYDSLLQMPFPSPLVYYTTPTDCHDGSCPALCQGLISNISGVNLTAFDTLGDKQQVFSMPVLDIIEEFASDINPESRIFAAKEDTKNSTTSKYNLMGLTSGEEEKHKVKLNPTNINELEKSSYSNFLHY